MDDKNTSILIVDDEAAVREALREWFRKDGFQADAAADGIEALKMLAARKWDIFLLDIKMPNIDGMELQRRIMEVEPNALVIMITAYASVETAVEALKQGAFDYLTKPIDPDDLSRIVRKAVEHQKLKRENVQLRNCLDEMNGESRLIGESTPMKKILEFVDTVSQSDVTVLIRGESGTGKELVARRIHGLSARRNLPLVPVNCGALTESLLESELFGHEKGAFTGAVYRHKGKFEMANGGTLFLDEIGTISQKTQVDLLRVLEAKQFSRLGGNQVISVDFRVICATNQNLEAMVKDGLFREDLYYRLNVFEMVVPPLRDRRSDITLLAGHFLGKYAKRLKKDLTGFSGDALETLEQYDWPGNVRELENAVERAAVVCKAGTIEQEHLPIRLNAASFEPEGSTLDDVEKAHIAEVLDQNEWNVSRSARTLGIDRVTLYNKIKKYKLERP